MLQTATSDRATRKSEKQTALDNLHSLIERGDTVYTVLRSVSKSGMSRTISLFVIKDGQPRFVTYNAARALGYSVKTVNGSDALVAKGCGMDVGFHVVTSLAYAMYGLRDEDGKVNTYALKQHWV